MIFINRGCGWDVEALATAAGETRPETRWICGLLAICWILLLICVSGLKAHTWFLIGVGGIGMLQNVYLAGASRTAGAFNFHYVPYSKRATIEALRLGKPHNKPLDEFRDPSGGLKPEVKPGGVMGALMALEELYPKAVASLVTVFFPGTLSYEPARLKWEKEFSENVFKPQSNGPNPPPPPRNVAQIVHPSFLFSNRKV